MSIELWPFRVGAKRAAQRIPKLAVGNLALPFMQPTPFGLRRKALAVAALLAAACAHPTRALGQLRRGQARLSFVRHRRARAQRRTAATCARRRQRAARPVARAGRHIARPAHGHGVARGREDKRFYEHSGIDGRAVSAAAWGNASGAPMWNVSGTSGAAPGWAEGVRWLHAREPRRAPATPAPLGQARSAFGPGADGNPLEAARSEWFLQGTEQPLFALDTGAGIATHGPCARISAPVDEAIIALDPDIPPLHQRVRLESEGCGVQWRIDGKHVACGNSAQWLPWPERHLIELLDASGKMLDQRRLEVRGAGVRAKSAPMRIERLRAYAERGGDQLVARAGGAGVWRSRVPIHAPTHAS